MFRICSFQGTVFSLLSKTSGDKEIRTLDPLLARQVLSQLSYIPICSYSDLSGLFLFSMKVFKPMGLSGPFLFSAKAFKPMDLIEPFLFSAKAFKPMGLSGLEPPTSRLSGVRSNQLSYKPFFNPAATCFPMPSPA